MVFCGKVLSEQTVVDKITKGEWTIKGIATVELMCWLFNDKYYNVYSRETKGDTTIFYAFDRSLKLFKIERKHKIDRAYEIGVITDILETNKDIVDFREQAAFEEDIEGYKNE